MCVKLFHSPQPHQIPIATSMISRRNALKTTALAVSFWATVPSLSL